MTSGQKSVGSTWEGKSVVVALHGAPQWILPIVGKGIGLVMCAVLILSLAGCTTFDNGANFVVTGLVQDSQTGSPISDATVVIIDSSLDYARRKSGNYRIAEGTVGEEGRFAIEFGYWWGRNGFLLYDGPTGSVKVTINAAGYRQKDLVLKCSDRNYIEGAFRFDVETIALDPVSSSILNTE